MKIDFLDLELKALKACIGKDISRSQLMGVHHLESHKMAVSTNGHCLAACASLYDDALKGKTIREDFRSQSVPFPDVVQVFPKQESPTHSAVIEIKKQHVVTGKEPTSIYLYDDGALSFDKRDDAAVRLDSAFLKPLIGYALKFEWSTNMDPIKIALHEGDGSFLLIMPIWP
jgi:hypothetical protein